MTPSFTDRTVTYARLAFWRFAASTTKLALQHHATLRKAAPLMPMLAFAFLAYLIGRWAGLLLLAVLV